METYLALKRAKGMALQLLPVIADSEDNEERW
jgi:hypothetical protein